MPLSCCQLCLSPLAARGCRWSQVRLLPFLCSALLRGRVDTEVAGTNRNLKAFHPTRSPPTVCPRGGATGYAVYATAYPALLRCTGVNIRILLKKKEKTTPRVASVVASATSGRPSSHGPTQQRKQIGLVQFASLDSPARRHSCRSVFPIGRPQTAVAQIGDRLIVTFDSGIARHRASLFRTQSTKASPAIQDASTNRRKAPNSRKVSIFY